MGQSHTTHRSQYQLQNYTVNYVRSIAQGGFSYVELVVDANEPTKVIEEIHAKKEAILVMSCHVIYHVYQRRVDVCFFINHSCMRRTMWIKNAMQCLMEHVNCHVSYMLAICSQTYLMSIY